MIVLPGLTVFRNNVGLQWLNNIAAVQDVIKLDANNNIPITTGAGTAALLVARTELRLSSTSAFSFASGADPGAVGADTYLIRAAANVLAIQNSTAACELRAYGTNAAGNHFIRLIHDGSQGYIAVAGDDRMYAGTNAAYQWFFGKSTDGYALTTNSDNTTDFCQSGARARSGFFGTSIGIGTNPATVGLVRLANNNGIYSRDAANSADITLLYVDGSNNVILGSAAKPLYLQGSTVNLNAGKIVGYNGVATAGYGVPAIYSAGRSTAQTAAVASVATYTNGAADGSFEVSANVLVTTATAHSFSVQVDYTDEGNTARTITLNFQQLAGTFVTTITNVTGAGPYEGVPLHIRCKASTAITVKTTGTFTTVTYNVEGSIRQIA